MAALAKRFQNNYYLKFISYFISSLSSKKLISHNKTVHNVFLLGLGLAIIFTEISRDKNIAMNG
jgi:hypothetical protein